MFGGFSCYWNGADGLEFNSELEMGFFWELHCSQLAFVLMRANEGLKGKDNVTR